jgi:N-acetylglucosamine-6-phosphate deacetylase
LVAGDVEVIDGRVAAVGVGAPGGSKIAAPGFVDLQVNGYAGVDFSAPEEAGYATARAVLLRDGVTAFQPTLAPTSSSSMTRSASSASCWTGRRSAAGDEGASLPLRPPAIAQRLTGQLAGWPA